MRSAAKPIVALKSGQVRCSISFRGSNNTPSDFMLQKQLSARRMYAD